MKYFLVFMECVASDFLINFLLRAFPLDIKLLPFNMESVFFLWSGRGKVECSGNVKFYL